MTLTTHLTIPSHSLPCVLVQDVYNQRGLSDVDHEIAMTALQRQLEKEEKAEKLAKIIMTTYVNEVNRLKKLIQNKEEKERQNEDLEMPMVTEPDSIKSKKNAPVSSQKSVK